MTMTDQREICPECGDITDEDHDPVTHAILLRDADGNVATFTDDDMRAAGYRLDDEGHPTHCFRCDKRLMLRTPSRTHCEACRPTIRGTADILADRPSTIHNEASTS